MSHTNPYFMREERSPYEFCRLLRSLPDSLDIATNSITDDQRAQLLAADEHAANYTSTLLNGLESMGRMLYSAAHNQRCPLQLQDTQQVGSLITEMAVQLQYLDDFREVVAGRALHTAMKESRK